MLPPPLRAEEKLSISLTNARFEELAVQAGIDLDAEDFRLEDLKMYSIEADIRKARHGGGANGSSSNNNNSNSDDIDDDDSLMDDGEAALQGALNSTNQKLTQKERSIYQLVDMLSKRLLSLNTVVADRSTGCKFDLDESTPLRSSQTRKNSLSGAATTSLGMILQGSSDDTTTTGDATGTDEQQQQQQHVSSIARTGATAGSSSATLKSTGGINSTTDGYTGSSSTAFKPTEEAYITDAARLTFRHAPSTESGKKLEALFNFEVPREGGGVTGSNGYNGNSYHHNGAHHKSAGNSNKQKRREARRMEARKHERMVYERKLQGNLERYVTRSVSDIIYRMPGSHNSNDTNEHDPLLSQFATMNTGNNEAAATTESSINSTSSVKSVTKAFTAPALARTSSQTTLQPSAAAAIPAVSHAVHDVVVWSTDDDVKLRKSTLTVGADEIFPIAVGGADMNPKLLLSYACERIVLPGGALSILDTRAKLFPEEAHEDVTAVNVTSTSAAATASSDLDYLPPLLNHAATSANGTTNMILHNTSNSSNNSTSSATASVPHGDCGSSYHGGVLSECDKQHYGDHSAHSIVSDASSLMSNGGSNSTAHNTGNYYFSGKKEHYRPVYHRPHCDGETSQQQQQQATGASSNSTVSTTTTCKQAAAARRIKNELAISVHMKAMSKTYRPQPLGHLT
eukprot:11906-Heterococcus_DN1.PRE.1